MTQQPATERIHALERQFEGLQAEVIAGARQAIDANRTTTRIAQAATSSPQANDNTFQIIFVDGTYNRVAGQQTPTYRNRQNNAHEYCYNLAGGVPPLGTKIVVHFWSGRWWTFWATGGSTPQPPSAGVSNVFTQPHWYYWGGVNDGTLASTGPNRRCCPELEHASYWCYFQNRSGPDIGIEVGPTYLSQIKITVPGLYRFDFLCTVMPGVFYESPGSVPANPPVPLRAEIHVDAGSLSRREGLFPYSMFPIGSTNFYSEQFGIDFNQHVVGDYVQVGQFQKYGLPSAFVDRWTFTPPVVSFVNFMVIRSNQEVWALQDNLNYGVEFKDSLLIVTRQEV